MKYNFEYLQPGDWIRNNKDVGFDLVFRVEKVDLNKIDIVQGDGKSLILDVTKEVHYDFKVKDIRFFTRQKNSDNDVYITDDKYREVINNYTRDYVSIDYGKLSDGYFATNKDKPSYRLSTPEEIKFFKENSKSEKDDLNKNEWNIGDKWKGFEVGKAYKHKKLREYNVFCGLDKYEQPVFEHFTNNGVHVNDLKSIVGTKKYWAYKGLENEFDLLSATNRVNINNQGELRKKDEDESTKVEYFKSIDDYSKATGNALVVAVSDDEPDYIVHTNTKEFCSEEEFEKFNCNFIEHVNAYKYREPTEGERDHFYKEYPIYEAVFNPEKIKDKSSLIKVKHRYIPKH